MSADYSRDCKRFRCDSCPRIVASLSAAAFWFLFVCSFQAAGQETEAGNTNVDSVAEAIPTEAEQRELGANEDPLAQGQVNREVERTEEEEDRDTQPDKTTGFDLYGSLRVRYRDQDGESDWQDSGSRAGIEWQWQFMEGSYLLGRYEAGFNVLTGVGDVINPGENPDEFEDSVFSRLGYIGIDAPFVTAIAGKNWSTYYKVAGFTDRFVSTGGSASGTFNAETDGGPTGTGRADRTIQSKFSTDFLPHKVFKPFNINFQVQHGNPIPFSDNQEYGTAVGLSALLTTQNNVSLGVAYNHAEVDVNPGLRKIGLNGDAQALLLGTRAFGNKWYAGLVVARLHNHETTDQGVYFDGWGSEFYGQYQLLDRFWLIGGYNALKPDSDQRLAGDYRVQYGVLGLRYTFDEFRRMLFFNARIDDSRNADGSSGSNVYTFGIRWDLSNKGWHVASKN